jgi:hypothetical protein
MGGLTPMPKLMPAPKRVKCPELLEPLINFFVDQGFSTIRNRVIAVKIDDWLILANGYSKRRRPRGFDLKPQSFTIYHRSLCVGYIKTSEGRWDYTLNQQDLIDALREGNNAKITYP